MNIIGELENARNYTAMRGPRCTICRYILTLSEDEAAALTDAFASDLMTSAITKALNNTGQQFAAMTVARHRKNECRGLA